MKRLIQAAAFIVPMFAATAAFAASALVTTPLHMRTGPSVGYPVITTMPDGAVVDVRGCVRGYDWCRVDWAGYDGWASANYLAFRSGHYVHRPFAVYGSTVGIPVISSVIIAPSHRHHWRRHERRHERRVERHHRRHERRMERRERRHDRREERRERRHEHKAEHRHERHERKAEHRQKRHERKVERRDYNVCPGGHRRHHGNC